MFMPDMNAYEEMNASAMDALSPQQAATLTRQMIEDLVSKLDIALAGREEVAGVDTYHLQAAPKPDASSTSFMGIPGVKPGPADLWIDPDTWTPLKIHVSVTEDLSAMAAQMGIEEGDPSQLGTMEVTMDMVVTDIAYDVDIPDETFTFEPPVGAQKMQPESFGVPGGPGGASGAEATVPASGAP
jgi:outer membrane lipoprotein-sorting protein